MRDFYLVEFFCFLTAADEMRKKVHGDSSTGELNNSNSVINENSHFIPLSLSLNLLCCCMRYVKYHFSFVFDSFGLRIFFLFNFPFFFSVL